MADFNLNNDLHFPSLPLRHSTQKYTSITTNYNSGFPLPSSPQDYASITTNCNSGFPLPSSPQKYTSTKPNYNSGSSIEDLSDTLLELIFERLFTWEHLASCKCVSKRWNSIISNPGFLRPLTPERFPLTVFVRSADITLLVTEHPYFKTHKLCHDFLPRNQYPDIVACHNDLLISFHSTSLDEASYCIANPVTKKFIVVPVTWTDDPEDEYYYYRRDSMFSSCLIGFAGVVDGVSTPGVTNLSNNNLGFRIVRVLERVERHYDDDDYYYDDYFYRRDIMVIYSSQTGKWKSILLEYPFFGNFDQAVTWNNKVHFTSKSAKNEILVIDPFDDDLAPRLLRLPDNISSLGDIVLGVCQNRLQIAGVSNPGSPTIEVWEFEDYEGDLITMMMSRYNKFAKLRSVVNFPVKRILLNMFSSSYETDITTYKLPSIQMRDYVTRIICCHPTDPDVVYVSFGHMLLRCDVVRRRLKVFRHDLKFSSGHQGFELSSTHHQRFLLMSPLTM